MHVIYFDQAASSFPKPKSVAAAVSEAILEYGANPGRGGHMLAKRAAAKIYQTRVKLAGLFGLSDPSRVLFFQNATGALNQGLKGLSLTEGDHVITSSYEHNSVRRPLENMKETIGIDISYFTPNPNGEIDETELRKLITAKTKLIVVTHGSNLTGMILPIKKIGKIAQEHQLLFMVDASQTAGVLPIDMKEAGIDLLAFAGHKGLMGPQGTGALLVKEGIDLVPLIQGGTGRYSESAEQPKVWPEQFESGTLNTPGIAGLCAGLEEIEHVSLKTIYDHETNLVKRCLEKLQDIEGLLLFGPDVGVPRLAVISLMIEGIDIHELATVLDQHYQIAVRAGLHCSPLAHQTVGTVETGSIRVSFGLYNTEQEIDTFIEAIKEIKVGFLG